MGVGGQGPLGVDLSSGKAGAGLFLVSRPSSLTPGGHPISIRTGAFLRDKISESSPQTCAEVPWPGRRKGEGERFWLSPTPGGVSLVCQPTAFPSLSRARFWRG